VYDTFAEAEQRMRAAGVVREVSSS
jgi:hypothetical protein